MKFGWKQMFNNRGRIAFTGGWPAQILSDWKEFSWASIFGSFCYDGQNEQSPNIKLHKIRICRIEFLKTMGVILRLHIIYLTLLFLFITNIKAQNFPITTVVQVTQFSPFIEAYDDPGRVIVTLLNTDERPEYEALIRISLSGPGFSIRTRPDYLPFPVVLRRNQPMILTGSMLREYFNPANLDFGGQGFASFQAGGGLLPEGPLSLCVEVFDYNRFFDPPVSNTGCANGVMLLQRPPLLIEPIGEIDITFSQQLRFQWQPQHAGVAVRYTLEVYEHILPGMADNLVIEATQPLIKINTVVPFYLMTNVDPLLQQNTNYLVRIRAEDVMGSTAFLNDGWSDVYTFYNNKLTAFDNGQNCEEPTGFHHLFTDEADEIQLEWDANPTVDAWLVINQEGDSTLLESTTQSQLVNDLTPDQQYTFILCAVCPDSIDYCVKLGVFLPDSVEVDTTICGAELIVASHPITNQSLFVTWNDIPEALGFILSWSEINTATNPRRERENQGAILEQNRNEPSSGASGILQLPTGRVEADINDLETGKTYEFELCKICPFGSQECSSWTMIFEGLHDECLSSIDFIRVDSTATSLKLTWIYDETQVSIDGFFDLIWQVSDQSLPADTAHLAYGQRSYTIENLAKESAYDLKICAECYPNQIVCTDLPPFGGCPAAYEPFVADIMGHEVLIAWELDQEDSLLSTQFRFKPIASPNWEDAPVGENQYFDLDNWGFITQQITELDQLNQQLTYVAQIQTQCVDTLWSDWSAPVTFCLECAVDDSLWVIDLSAYSANVMGVAHSNAISYAFEYRLAGSDNWTVIEDLNQPLLLLEDLQNTTTYEVRMRYLCNRGPWSDYTSSFFFTTLPPCGIPELSSIDPIYADEAQLNWLAGNNAVETKVRYRLKRNGLNTFLNAPWQSIITPDNSKILDELRGGGTYQFQMQSDCGVNESEWTTMDEFVLLCAPPDVLEATDLTYHSARINLSQLSPSVVSYQVEYKLSEDSTWTSVSTSYPTTLLQNLDDLAYYDLRVSCNCSSGETSVYSDTIQFQTPVKCLLPENLIVSDIQPLSATIEWDITGTMLEWEILLLDEDPINDTPLESSSSESLPPRQTSGNDTADESQENTNADQGGNHDNSVGILLGNGSNSPTNNSAPNATEEESAIAPRATPIINPYADWQRFTVTDPNKFFQDLLPDHPYRVVVRARCVQAGWTDYSEELPFTTLADCKPAKALFADQVYQETARTNWSKGNHFDDEYVINLESVEAIMLRPQNGTAAAQNTDFRIGRDGNPTETTATTTENLVLAIYHDSIQTTELNAIFEGLQPNTDYRFQVKTRCDNYGWTNYSDWTIFHTDECALPTDIIEEAIDRSTMRISWTPDYGQNDYEFKYRLAEDPGAQWVFINTIEPTVELTSLLSNQIYDYQISEVCKGGTGNTSVPQDSFLMERPSLNNGFYLCGMETSVDLSNQSPLSELVSGDTIIAFDFLISITQASGGGGYFSGTGEINLPYFNKAKFAFTFDDIFVNDEYRMVGGYFEATGFGVEVLPPWADSLLADIVDILEEVDELLADEQVEVLDSLMNCCANSLPPGLQNQIQGVLDCYAQQDLLENPNYTICEAQLDSLMTTINDDLDSIIIDLDIQIIESLTLDIIRTALDELSDIHAPLLPDIQSDYYGVKQTFDTNYKRLAIPPDLPDYSMGAIVLEVGNVSSQNSENPIGQFGESSMELQQTALSLVTEDMLTNTSGELPNHPTLKTFALSLRQNDIDVYTPIHTQVEALWNGAGNDNFDQEPLIDEARQLLIQKINFLVNQ